MSLIYRLTVTNYLIIVLLNVSLLNAVAVLRLNIRRLWVTTFESDVEENGHGLS